MDINGPENKQLPSYRVTIAGSDGSLYHGDWFEVEQTPEQMRTRIEEFSAMMRNHCYQLTVNDQFIGNFRRRRSAEEAVDVQGDHGRPVLIEVFPTSRQRCLDD